MRAKLIALLPNILSISRYLFAVAIVAAIIDGPILIPAIIYVIAVGTDLSDGYLARKYGTTSQLGGFLDHSADAVFVSASLAAFAYLQLTPAWLPVVVILAFTQYALDSDVLKGQPLRASSLGRYNGIAYYVYAAFLIGLPLLADTFLTPGIIYTVGWGLVLSTLLSMLDRLVGLLSLKHKTAD